MQGSGRGDIGVMTARMMTTDARRADPSKRPDAPIDAATLDHLTDELLSLLSQGGPDRPSLKAVMESLERSLIVRTLTAFNGHQAKTATFLRLLPTTFSAKMRKHKVTVECTWTASPEPPPAGPTAGGETAVSDPEITREPDPDSDA